MRFPPDVPITDDPNAATEHPAAPPVHDEAPGWPKALRRGPLEGVAMGLIGIGVVMMCQPFSIAVYGWSFLVVLTGTVTFLVVSHFPE